MAEAKADKSLINLAKDDKELSKILGKVMPDEMGSRGFWKPEECLTVDGTCGSKEQLAYYRRGHDGWGVEVRKKGDFAGRSLFLSSKYRWQIQEDDSGNLILVARAAE